MFHGKNNIQWRSEDRLWELVYLSTMWVSEVEFRSLSLAKSAFIHGASSLAPDSFFLEDKIHKDKDSGLFHFCSQQFLMFIPLDLLLKLCLFLNVLVFENVIHVYNVS